MAIITGDTVQNDKAVVVGLPFKYSKFSAYSYHWKLKFFYIIVLLCSDEMRAADSYNPQCADSFRAERAGFLFSSLS